MLPRAIVLLSCLLLLAPLLASAAPAPFPRRASRPAAVSPAGRGPAGWPPWGGRCVGRGGGRVPARPRYRGGERVGLVLETQNVRREPLVLDEPHLARYVEDPGDEQSGWAI